MEWGKFTAGLPRATPCAACAPNFAQSCRVEFIVTDAEQSAAACAEQQLAVNARRAD
jgi:hypothetical protein